MITTCASNLGNVCIALMAASASQPLEFWSDDLAVLREIAPMAASASRADGSANVFARTAVESFSSACERDHARLPGSMAAARAGAT